MVEYDVRSKKTDFSNPGYEAALIDMDSKEYIALEICNPFESRKALASTIVARSEDVVTTFDQTKLKWRNSRVLFLKLIGFF